MDEKIKVYAKNWDFHRIAAVDRNIMRLAIYEMLHRDDIPPVVSINEAVDIAKKFSTQDSGKFVNGILDKIKGEVMRPDLGNERAPSHQRRRGCRPSFAHAFFRRHLHAGGIGGAAADKPACLAMALTDHDTVEGCEPMARACAAVNIEFIPGTELTAEHEESEVHRAGLFSRIFDHTILLAEIKKFQTVRQDRDARNGTPASINWAFRCSAETVFELANCRSPGRPHVARAMVRRAFAPHSTKLLNAS